MTGSAEDYPFRPNEPWQNVYKAKGLEKLCYVPDRALTQQLYEMHFALRQREGMMAVLRDAHSGMLGPDAERLAKRHFGPTLGHPSAAAGQEFIRQLNTVKRSKAAAPVDPLWDPPTDGDVGGGPIQEPVETW